MRVEKTLGASIDEVRRQLTRLEARYPVVSSAAASLTFALPDQGTAEVSWCTGAVRQIALLAIPTTQLVIETQGGEATVLEGFIADLERVIQRGGG